MIFRFVCRSYQQHPCVAGTSGFRSACKSVGKVLWPLGPLAVPPLGEHRLSNFTSGWY